MRASESEHVCIQARKKAREGAWCCRTSRLRAERPEHSAGWMVTGTRTRSGLVLSWVCWHISARFCEVITCSWWKAHIFPKARDQRPNWKKQRIEICLMRLAPSCCCEKYLREANPPEGNVVWHTVSEGGGCCLASGEVAHYARCVWWQRRLLSGGQEVGVGWGRMALMYLSWALS